MPEVIETTVYQFDELSDEAKEKAREWYRSVRDESDLQFCIEDFGQVCDILGIDLATQQVQLMGGGTRQDPAVSYSLGYSQSDFAAFDGTYSYRKGAAKKIRDYTGNSDEKLADIADRLQAVQKRYAYGVRAKVSYHHYYGLQVEAYRANDHELTAEDHQEVKEAMRDLANWLYWLLRKEDEYQSEDEQVDENITANEYTFTAEGRRFG